jgi:glycosyltransferase involved in cell wall biosynthesis
MKKSILFFHHASTVGGATVSGLNFLSTLDSKLYEITIYCNTKLSFGAANTFLKAGYKVLKAGGSPVQFSHYSGGESFALSPKNLLNGFSILKDNKKINNVIYEENPDIVIVNSMTLFWIGKIAKKYNKETICFMRETYAKGLFGIRTSLIKEEISKYFDKVAFISDFDFKNSISLKCKKETIYNAIKIESYDTLDRDTEFSRLRLKDEHFNILYLGGMSRLKGAHIIIKALSKIKEENIKIIFVGYVWNGKRKRINDCKNWKQKLSYILNTDYEKKCINLIIKYNLINKIKFYNTNNNVASFFVTCDALVLPATKPHQARPAFEAGYSKIPVVISDFPNIRENINEKTGFLFENRNYNQLALILDRLANGELNVFEKVRENYNLTINRHTDKIYCDKISKFMRD